MLFLSVWYYNPTNHCLVSYDESSEVAPWPSVTCWWKWRLGADHIYSTFSGKWCLYIGLIFFFSFPSCGLLVHCIILSEVLFLFVSFQISEKKKLSSHFCSFQIQVYWFSSKITLFFCEHMFTWSNFNYFCYVLWACI